MVNIKKDHFFGELVDFITSGPVFAMVWEGENVIATARNMMGKTNPSEAAPSTIRGDFGVTVGKNIIHGSDSPESAEREINLFFDENELVSYEKVDTIGFTNQPITSVYITEVLQIKIHDVLISGV